MNKDYCRDQWLFTCLTQGHLVFLLGVTLAVQGSCISLSDVNYLYEHLFPFRDIVRV